VSWTNLKILQTPVFEKDAKRLDGGLRKRLGKTIEKIAANPLFGKPLRHAPCFFSERIENFRLVYRFQNNELLLICFKNRDEVYQYLKGLT